MSRRPAVSIVASPVLVGALTVLVTVVAVFLAYNANQGLPFVPTYRLSAELPGGANLVAGNDVRIGGFRVGLVEEIRPRTVVRDGRRRAIAVVDMSLDRLVEPLPADTRVVVRPRSALGLKYVELTPGRSPEGHPAGSTIPLAQAEERAEFDDVLATFDGDTRAASRQAIAGFGDALAGRGPALNRAIHELRPFVTHLEPVMRTLSDPDTELDRLFGQIGRAAAEAAPVARVQAELFTDMADTFAALSECRDCLRATIERGPPTTEAAISSFRAQRPFLADFTEVSRELRPAARHLARSLPALTRAVRAGGPALERSVALNRRQRRLFVALDDLAERPALLRSLEGLETTVTVGTPLLEFVAPYQTVCSYASLFFYGLGEHLSATIPGATYQRQLLNSTTDGGNPIAPQDNRINNYEADRPPDVPANRSPIYDTDIAGDFLQALHATPYTPAVDAQGNADCGNGQFGWIEGPFTTVDEPRYPPAADTVDEGTPTTDWYRSHAGGSHVVVGSDTPGLLGPTYTSRLVGIDHLDDVK